MISSRRVKEALRERVPHKRRRQIAKYRITLRRPTARLRRLPDFLIIGAQRSGTSSLYKYLDQHPDISSSLRKETEYFTRYFDHGVGWYRAHFGTSFGAAAHQKMSGNRVLNFEATPDYMLDIHAPRRASQLLPSAKIIAILRNPAERAYSGYKHMTRLGFEDLTFEEALERETERIAYDIAKYARDEWHYPRDLVNFSYKQRGFYGEQISRWLEHYDRSNVLILSAENLFANPEQTLTRVFDFLSVRHKLPDSFDNHSYVGNAPAAQSPIDPALYDELMALYSDDIQTVYRLAGEDFGWLER